MLSTEIDNDLREHALLLARKEWDEPADLYAMYRAGSDDGANKCTAYSCWFPVNAESRREGMARDAIAARGLPVCLPMVPRKRSMGRGRYKLQDGPMFPGYIFVNCDPSAEHWQRISSARGVRSLTCIGGRPVPIRSGEIEVIRLVEARMALPENRQKIVWHFSPGDMVRIRNGPFACFHAKLETAVDEHGRIEALVEIFGRWSKTIVSADDLEAL